MEEKNYKIFAVNRRLRLEKLMSLGMVHKEKSQGRLFLCEKVFNFWKISGLDHIKLKHALKFQRDII